MTNDTDTEGFETLKQVLAPGAHGGCQKEFALIGSSLAADRPSGLGDVASGARSVGRPQVAVVRPPIEAEDGRSVSLVHGRWQRTHSSLDTKRLRERSAAAKSVQTRIIKS